jgi:hypothetical protein
MVLTEIPVCRQATGEQQQEALLGEQSVGAQDTQPTAHLRWIQDKLDRALDRAE